MFLKVLYHSWDIWSIYLKDDILDEYMWMKLWRQKYCRGKQRKYRDKVLKEFREWYKTSGLEFFYTPNKRRYVS